MIDKVLTWVAGTWIAVLVIAYVLLGFAVELEPGALFHIGWVPIVPMPNPLGLLTWCVFVLLALPAIGMFKLRNYLRRRRA